MFKNGEPIRAVPFEIQRLQKLKESEENKVKEFTKADLKTGMWVEYRDGRKRVVILNTDIGDKLCEVEDSGLFYVVDLRTYTDNLKFPATYRDNKEADIMKVFKNDGTLTWERKEQPPTKEITIKDIEEKFGCKVKIVDGE